MLPPHSGRSVVLLAIMLSMLTPASAGANCPASPRPLCRDLAQTKISIDAERGDFQWKGSLGPSTTRGDFGDPRATTSYSICAWDGTAPVVSTSVPAAATCDGSSCWSDKGSAGLRFRDRTGALRSVDLLGSANGRTRVRVQGSFAAGAALPVTGRLTVQLLRDDAPICFEGSVPAAALATNDGHRAVGKTKFDAASVVPALASAGCGGDPSPYVPGTSIADSLMHDGLARTFRVWLPPAYDPSVPFPVVFLLHGGFGSGAQVESSSHMLEAAAAEGFVVVSPDGVPNALGIRTWDAGNCCGYAVDHAIDDVGFVAAILDRLESRTCVDLRRVYATGMSNGSMLAHRVGCDLADRVRAIANVSGTDETVACAPARPVPELTIHGTADQNVPYDGGPGCGLAGVAFRSVPSTLAAWRERDDCADTATSTAADGDATCTSYGKCAAGNEVEACIIDGGGHQWPGGDPPALSGIGSCPFGYQSESFPASPRILAFFERHPLR